MKENIYKVPQQLTHFLIQSSVVVRPGWKFFLLCSRCWHKRGEKMKFLGVIIVILIAIGSFDQSEAWPVSNPEMLNVSQIWSEFRS